MPSRPRGHFGIARSVRLFVRQSVPWRSCLQLSHRRSPEICGLRNRPRTDVDPSRFLIGDKTILHRRTAIGKGAYRLAPSSPRGGRYLVTIITIIIQYSVNCRCAGKEADDFCVSRFSRLRQATDAGGEDHEDRSATTHYHHLPDRPHLRYLRRLVVFTARRYAPLFHLPVSCPIFFIFLGFKPPMGFPA